MTIEQIIESEDVGPRTEMNIPDQIKRITKMELTYNELAAQFTAAHREVKRLTELLPQLQELETYYENGDWQEDYDADQQGLIPGDLNRGILCEDTIYDLLTDRAELLSELCTLLEKLEETAG
ncbi:MAG: DUF4298 domain-containing protein [Eubacteriales bacterium]|nr:DUF4298 domain-containing protein [Eubacteriales bacterium]